MIIGLILNVFFIFVGGVLSLLPTGHINSEITNAINWFFYSAHSFDFIIPVGTIIQVLLWAVAFEIIIALWSLLLFVINKIRGI